MNMNDTIDLSGISTDNVYRIRRSKKNGKLISYNEYGKVIIIKNWKSLHLDDKYKNSNNNIAARHMFRISGVETKKYELSERPVTLNL